jgi:capsular polysaccharide export protein
MPFYAGWGLTTDHLICTRRGRSLSLDELVYGALIYYPRYLSQRSGCFITAEQAVEELAMQRRDCKGWPGSRSILASTPFSISPRVQFAGAQLAARFKDALDGILPDSLV